MHRTALMPLVLVALAVGAACADAQDDRTVPIIGLPCEGCDAVFVGMPEDLTHRARLAPIDEPGEPMVIRGTVYDGAGDPAPGVIVYAYQTDASGVYPPDDRYTGWARRHGRLRGWVRTDEQGRYRFDTIRPASYPDSDNPAHVHMHVIEPDCCTYYIDSIHFTDDPLLDEDARADADGRGGPGIVTPRRVDGMWEVERDIRLGHLVPGYD